MFSIACQVAFIFILNYSSLVIHHIDLPVEKIVQLLSFLESLIVPAIKGTLVTYKHCFLYWKSPLEIDVDDVYPLYEYLTDPETGKIADGIVNQVKEKGEVLILFLDGSFDFSGHCHYSTKWYF